jgi:hypothetical protein
VKANRSGSGRCSPTKALKLLHPAFEPTAAAAELTRAVHGRCPIICNGVVIRSHIVPLLKVVAQQKRGHWTARIVGTFAVGGLKPTDVWKFDIDKVEALSRTQLREDRSRPGSADAWIDHVCPDGEWRLMTVKGVHKKIEHEAKKLGVGKAPSYSAVAAALLKRPT